MSAAMCRRHWAPRWRAWARHDGRAGAEAASLVAACASALVLFPPLIGNKSPVFVLPMMPMIIPIGIATGMFYSAPPAFALLPLAAPAVAMSQGLASADPRAPRPGRRRRHHEDLLDRGWLKRQITLIRTCAKVWDSK